MRLDDKIRQYLMEKDRIDVLDAAQLFGCFSLPQVIGRLRQRGVRIKAVTSKRRVRLDGKSMEMEFNGYVLQPERRIKKILFHPPSKPGGVTTLHVITDSKEDFGLRLKQGQTTEELANELRKFADSLER